MKHLMWSLQKSVCAFKMCISSDVNPDKDVRWVDFPLNTAEGQGSVQGCLCF